MSLHFLNLLPGEVPITSVAGYLARRHQYDELTLKLHALQLEIKRQRDEGKSPEPKLFNELDLVDVQRKQMRSEFFRCQPYVLISRCPYCEKAIWMKVGIFSLMDEFWYQVDGDGRESTVGRPHCQHLFCIDGALNLKNLQPTDAYAPPSVVTTNKIPMAAEVPFVKPRVLNLPTRVAVVHSLPVSEKYVAYPVVYFAEKQPKQAEFCIGWARSEYVAYTGKYGSGREAVVMIGRRSDKQDYELEKWVKQSKLFWLDPEQEENPLVRDPISAFPYNNLPGRRHPYYLEEGQVYDLPDPVESEPEIRQEY